MARWMETVNLQAGQPEK